MLDTNIEIFDGMTLANVLKEIHTNSAKKRRQIDILIDELRPLVKTSSEAMVVVPLIKEYLEVGVKNDEQLVKMAQVVQRMASTDKIAAANGGSSILTDEEKKQLLDEVKNATKESDAIMAENDKKLKQLEEKTNEIKTELESNA